MENIIYHRTWLTNWNLFLGLHSLYQVSNSECLRRCFFTLNILIIIIIIFILIIIIITYFYFLLFELTLISVLCFIIVFFLI